MAISFSQVAHLNCPECKVAFMPEVWLIVDAVERPDLAARCSEGAIHVVTCPNGHSGMLGAPLLYHDRSKKQLILAFPPQMPREQVQETGSQLISQLKSKLLILPGSEYLDSPQAIPSDLLPAAIAGKLEEVIAQAQAEIEKNPAFAAALAVLRDNPSLAEAAQGWLSAGAKEKSMNWLETHPELLTDNGSKVLNALLDLSQAQGDEDGVQVLTEHRDLLLAAMKDGIQSAYESFDEEQELPSQAQAELEARLAELDVRSEADLERAVKENPELQEMLGRAMIEENPMLQALNALVMANSPEDVRQAADEYPVLLTNEAIQAIRVGIDNARNGGQQDMANHIQERLDMLVKIKGGGTILKG